MKKIILSTVAITGCLHLYAQLPNASMEQWRNVGVPNKTFELPIDWNSADSLVTTLPPLFVPTSEKHIFQTTDAATGSRAAMVMSRNLGGTLGVLPGVLSNAQVGFDILKFDPNNPSSAIIFSGGTPVSGRVGGVKAMTKYTSKGTDTGALAVRAIWRTGSKDSLIGEGYAIITASSSYQQTFAPINYINASVTPTHIIVAFASSARSSRVDSSTIYVDDVDFVTVGINDIDREQVVNIFPNPAKDKISLDAGSHQGLTCEVHNLYGQKVAQQLVIGKAVVDLSHLPNGIYPYRIINQEGVAVQRGKLNIAR